MQMHYTVPVVSVVPSGTNCPAVSDICGLTHHCTCTYINTSLTFWGPKYWPWTADKYFNKTIQNTYSQSEKKTAHI